MTEQPKGVYFTHAQTQDPACHGAIGYEYCGGYEYRTLFVYVGEGQTYKDAFDSVSGALYG